MEAGNTGEDVPKKHQNSIPLKPKSHSWRSCVMMWGVTN